MRRRVVWQVRHDVELLAADIQRELDGQWALLGSHAAFAALDWGDSKLRLPRMRDSLFGVELQFPLESDDDAAVRENAQAQETDGSSTPSASDADSELNESQPVGCNTRASGERDTSQGSEQDVAGISSAPSGCTSAAETRSAAPHQADTSVHAETADDQRQVERVDGTTARSKDEQRRASIQEILSTHSRDEILLELQWARQALCDRRKYLQSRRRVEQDSHPRGGA